jgi:hypothetical protein
VIAQNPAAEAERIQICKMTTLDSILPAMTQFDALHPQKYAHVYEQRAIAD